MSRKAVKPGRKSFFTNVLMVVGVAIVSMLAACSGSAGNPSESPEQASESASEEPVATVTPAPPETVDLSLYDEIPLPQLEEPAAGEELAILNTSMGTIKVRFFPEYAPKAVQNWKTRAKSGYYDGTIFHRVINDFMIQGGDPEGTGMGGESIWGAPFEMEIDPSLHFIRGALGMARSSEEVSQGSQFFIIQAPTLSDDNKQYVEDFKDIQNQVAAVDAEGNKIPIAQFFPLKIIDKYVEDGGYPSLDFNYTVFGQVVEGLDVVDAIAAVETSKDEASLDKPLADVVLESISFEQHS